jgi:hypothetical protein
LRGKNNPLAGHILTVGKMEAKNLKKGDSGRFKVI